MMTAFFSINCIILLGILLEKAKLSSEYVNVNVIKELDLTVSSPAPKSLAFVILCADFRSPPISTRKSRRAIVHD
jgi:hypothetical protein